MNYNFSQKRALQGAFLLLSEIKPHLCIVDQQNVNKIT